MRSMGSKSGGWRRRGSPQPIKMDLGPLIGWISGFVFWESFHCGRESFTTETQRISLGYLNRIR